MDDSRSIRYLSQNDIKVTSIGIGAPACVAAPWSRSNQFSTSMTGYMNSYNWTLPRASQEPCIANNNCNCVLRIRYNVSLADINTATLKDANNPSTGFIDWTYNGAASPVTTDPIITVDGVNYSLPISTSQTGRTFEDRSFVFNIRPRGANVPDTANIYNLNVRGKRGNTAQVFPAVQVFVVFSKN